MNSNYYQQTLVNTYVNQELTKEDFESTLLQYASLCVKEAGEKVCNSCGCPQPERRYDHFWCKVCHNAMNL